jgi:hypothetical protein
LSVAQPPALHLEIAGRQRGLPITMEKDYTPVYREIFERSNEQGWWAFNQPSLLQDKKRWRQ